MVRWCDPTGRARKKGDSAENQRNCGGFPSWTWLLGLSNVVYLLNRFNPNISIKCPGVKGKYTSNCGKPIYGFLFGTCSTFMVGFLLVFIHVQEGNGLVQGNFYRKPWIDPRYHGGILQAFPWDQNLGSQYKNTSRQGAGGG